MTETTKFINKFQELYDNSPNDLKHIVNLTKSVKQNPKWHPEIYVYEHIKIVTNRLHNNFDDINLTLAGYFHDLGKIISTKWDDEKETWTAYNHEYESSFILNSYRQWVENQGGDFVIVKFIVLNHMRIKFFDDFRFNEKMRFINHPHFELLRKFASADYGGCDSECKSLMDITHVENDIEEFNKREKEDKIISSKFNGKIIMNLYPGLKGKELGNAINKFKDNFDDFRNYILLSNKEQIIKDFNNFYKGLYND